MRLNASIRLRTAAAASAVVLSIAVHVTEPAQAEDFGTTAVAPIWNRMCVTGEPFINVVPAVLHDCAVPPGFRLLWGEQAGPMMSQAQWKVSVLAWG